MAENIILKRKLAEIERIVSARQERKHGKRLVLKGKTVVSTLEVLEQLKKCEEVANMKKKKRGPTARKNQVQDLESTSEEDKEAGEIESLDEIEVVSLRHCRR